MDEHECPPKRITWQDCRTFAGLRFPPLPVLADLLVPQRLEVLNVHGEQGALTWRAAVGAHALHAVPLGLVRGDAVQAESEWESPQPDEPLVSQTRPHCCIWHSLKGSELKVDVLCCAAFSVDVRSAGLQLHLNMNQSHIWFGDFELLVSNSGLQSNFIWPRKQYKTTASRPAGVKQHNTDLKNRRMFCWYF